MYFTLDVISSSVPVSPSVCLPHKYYFLFWLIGGRRGGGRIPREPPQRLVNAAPPPPHLPNPLAVFAIHKAGGPADERQRSQRRGMLIRRGVTPSGSLSVTPACASVTLLLDSTTGTVQRQERNLRLWFCTPLL